MLILLMCGAIYAQDKPDAKPTPKVAVIEVPEIDSLRWQNLRLAAQNQRAQEQAAALRAASLERQADEAWTAIKARLCKAKNVNPDDYDGQFTATGVTLVLKEPPAPKETKP
jgi:hypothetical protein